MDNQEVIQHKDARILWKYEKRRPDGDWTGKIEDLVVVEFILDEEGYYQGPHHLYKEYDADIGNCNSSWEKWHPVYTILHIFCGFEFVDNNAKGKALKELSKISDLHEPIIKYFTGPFAYNDGPFKDMTFSL